MIGSGFAIVLGDVYRHPTAESVNYVPNVYDRRAAVPEGTFAAFFLEKLGFDPLLVFLVLFILLPAIFFGAGVISARQQRDFYLVERDGQELIVLRTFGDQLVASPLGASQDTYEREYLLIEAIDAGPLRAVTLKAPITAASM
jgi:hypothetical protein